MSRFAVAIFMCVLLLLALPGDADAAEREPESPAVLAFVELTEPPTARSGQGAPAQQRRILAQQERFLAAMENAGVEGGIVYRVQRALNGIAMTVPREQLATLRRLPGVQGVQLLELEQRNRPAPPPFGSVPESGCSSNRARANGQRS